MKRNKNSTFKEQNVNLDFNIPIEIHRKSKRRFISKCPLLTIFSEGRTEREAKDNLINSLNMYLETCIQTRKIGIMLENEVNHYDSLLTNAA